MLCEDVCSGGDGDELAQDVLGHLDIVLGDLQGLLDVLVGVALAHQVLDLAAEGWCYRHRGQRHRYGCSRGHGARAPVGVDPPGQRLRGTLGSFAAV